MVREQQDMWWSGELNGQVSETGKVEKSAYKHLFWQLLIFVFLRMDNQFTVINFGISLACLISCNGRIKFSWRFIVMKYLPREYDKR